MVVEISLYVLLHILALFTIISQGYGLLAAILHPANLLISIFYLHYLAAYLMRIVSVEVYLVTLFAEAIVVTWLIAAKLFARKRKIKKIRSENNEKYYEEKIYYATLITLFILYFLFIYILNEYDLNPITYLLLISTYYIEIRKGTAWLLMLMPFASVLSLLAIAVNNTMGVMKFLLLYISVCLLLLMTGARASIIVYSIQVYCLLYMRAGVNLGCKLLYKKIKKLFIFILLPMFAFFFSVATSLRTEVNFDEYFNETFLVDFDKGRNIKKFNEKYDNTIFGVYHGATLSDILQMFMPRVLFPEKEISTYGTRDLNPEEAEYGSNDTFGILTLAYMNFGIIGVALEVLFFTLCYSKIFNFILYPQGLKIAEVLAVSIASGFFYILINGGLLTHFIFLYVLQVIFAFAILKYYKNREILHS